MWVETNPLVYGTKSCWFKARGVRQVLLVVLDDLTGVKEVVKRVYDSADRQLCMAHKIRNALSKWRQEDLKQLAEALKKIHQAPDRTAAKRDLEEATEKWKSKYPQILSTWKDQIDQMLTFME